MEIEVGEYIRTESGIIEKIKTFDEQTNIFKDEKGKLQKWLGETVFGDPYCEEIVKHSKNIIDLIQCGDYVNGHLVFDKAPNCVYIEDNQNKLAHIPYTKEKIKSVVTKEQYEQNSYKL